MQARPVDVKAIRGEDDVLVQACSGAFLNFYAFIPISAILVSSAFGAVSLVWNSERRGTRSMAALFACTFAWGLLELLAILEGDPAGAMSWLRWIHLPPLMIGPVVLWIVAQTLPQANTASLRRKTWLAALCSLTIGIVAGLLPGTIESVEPNGAGGWIPRQGPLAYALMLLGLVVPCHAVRIASATRQRADRQRSDRRRAWGVGIAFAISVAITLSTEFVLPALGVAFPRLGCIGVSLSVAVVWLSVLHDDEDLLLTPQGVARALLERLQDGVALVQLDGRVLSCNERFAELAGVEETGSLGASIEALIDAPLDRIRAGVEDRESTLRPVSGGTIPISLSSSVARGRTGSEIGYVVVVRDLRELDALRTHLMGSGRLAAIGELAAGIAHEVNNPVAFMRSDLNLMRERVAEVRARLLGTTFGHDGVAPLDRTTERIDRALEGLGRVSQIVVDVRDFAHAGGAGQGGSDPQRVVEGAMRLARLERDEEVTLAIVRAHAPTVISCGQELKQALLAVLRLLVGATEKGGEVRASLRSDSSVLEVEFLATPLREDVAALEDRFAATALAGPAGASDLALVAVAELIGSLGGELRAQAVGEDALRVEVVVPLEEDEAIA